MLPEGVRDREMIPTFGLWVRRFHADPSVIGRTAQVNGHETKIIGVLPMDSTSRCAWRPRSATFMLEKPANHATRRGR